ncbi:hypothetical protein CR513_48734, partial [Mucuna pruriens]
VCGFIWFFVDDNVYNHITSEIHARTLWEKIEPLYASKCENNKLFLLNSIEFEVQGRHFPMSGMSIKFEDEILALLLNFLPES